MRVGVGGVGIGQEVEEFGDHGGDDRGAAGVFGVGLGEGAGDGAEAASVGGDGVPTIVPGGLAEFEVGADEGGAGVAGVCLAEFGEAECLAEFAGGDGEGGAGGGVGFGIADRGHGGEGWEFFGGQCVEFELAFGGADGDLAVFDDGEGEFVRGDGAEDVGEAIGRDCDGEVFVDGEAREVEAEPEVEVGGDGGEGALGAIGREEDVMEDWEGGAFAGDAEARGDDLEELGSGEG